MIVGAGGFGREVLDVLRAMDPEQSEFEFAGFVADDEPDAEVLARIEAPWLGTPSQFLAAPTATHYVVGIAAPRVRERLAKRFDAAGLEAATLIHPTVTFGCDVVLGAGTIMCAGSGVTTNIRVGRHVHIDRQVTVGHDTTIGDFVTLHPGTVVSGGVTIATCSLLGTTSCVLPGRSVGSDVVVGAGALVTRDVPDRTTVVGVPARPSSR